MPKKLLSTILAERSESVKYRKIRTDLIKQAQNLKRSFIVLKSNMDNYSLITLQNEGINISEINEFGFDKYLLEW